VPSPAQQSVLDAPRHVFRDRTLGSMLLL